MAIVDSKYTDNLVYSHVGNRVSIVLHSFGTIYFPVVFLDNNTETVVLFYYDRVFWIDSMSVSNNIQYSQCDDGGNWRDTGLVVHRSLVAYVVVVVVVAVVVVVVVVVALMIVIVLVVEYLVEVDGILVRTGDDVAVAVAAVTVMRAYVGMSVFDSRLMQVSLVMKIVAAVVVVVVLVMMMIVLK